MAQSSTHSASARARIAEGLGWLGIALDPDLSAVENAQAYFARYDKAKSATSEIPALIRHGAGLVVSPLIALMDDQVAQLSGKGVVAGALHSHRTPEQRIATGAAFEAGARLAAIINASGDRVESALAAYGRHLGLAFQMVDDALDYGGSSADLGKDVGDDFREGKITLPVILAYRRGSDEERAFWRRTIADGDISDPDLDQAMSLIQSHNAIKATLERARHYGSMAKDALAIFRESKAKSALLDVVDFSTSRAN